MSLGIVVFVSLTVHSSVTTANQVSSVVASEQVTVGAQVEANSATQQVIWGALVKGAQEAYRYGKEFFKAHADGLDDLMRKASIYPGSVPLAAI
ncbi:hypothetical protein PAALTS15_02952 [Paenibacillus alvei TS-15]|uniref:Uncharacterized protein n=1 Tax=Paenibacillus alvei TS-15 TaxID=1117108 RepID=S9SW54_PAEAL|nr:hypothetical protein [Paenibacillus alvei]EPY08894.1 hypothetical protein PAALTS15_02952 [Paenibacillus alvei TS-15]